MNTPFIVFLKNKNASEFVYNSTVLRVEQTSQTYRITFKNGRSYTYAKDKVRYYPLLSTQSNVRIYEKGKLNPRYNTVANYGPYLIFSNESYTSQAIENNDDIEICGVREDTEPARLLLDYFKYLLGNNGEVSFDIPSAEDSEDKDISQISSNILLKALDTIQLEESRSALSKYIDGVNPTLSYSNKRCIFPFGCNESQKLAVETSLSTSISIIEGPPGTGKTQTILNIIANLVIQGKNVAVVSNNNSAVFNVKEKLEKYGYGSLVASLGNNKNKEDFFNPVSEQQSLSVPTISKEDLQEAEEELHKLEALLATSFKNRNRLAQLQTELSDIKLEFRHVMAEQSLPAEVKLRFDAKFYRKLNVSKLLKIQEILSSYHLQNKLTLKQKLRLLFQYGLFDFESIKSRNHEFNIFLNYTFYELSIAKIEAEVEQLTTWLILDKTEKNLKQYVEVSKVIFDAGLFERQKAVRKFNFNKDNYLQQFTDFIKSYPVVLSSTLSLHTSIPKDFLFDYVIIDESSQVDIIKSAVCFSCAKNVVVVGDSRQLSHIVDKQSQQASTQFRLEHKIPEAYDYVTQNILTSLKTLYGNKIQAILLKEHYRCHPAIIEFCNKKYYNNELLVMTRGEKFPFKLIETSISGERLNYNQRQIDETDAYIRSNYLEDYSKVGVIAPYRSHADRLQNQLPKEVEADTIHKFQGREKEVIIFNTVRGSINPFMDNANLINVAVSRAVKEFILIKPASMELPHGTNIGDLIRYISYTAGTEKVVQKGSVCSVFDLLYKEYNKSFEAFIDANRHIAGSAAEIILYKLLKEQILSKNPLFSSIAMVREYKLRDLVINIEQFPDEEAQFIKNNSRLDFLLYNKIDKTPVLAIEVDGVSFHDNQLQQERDRKKNNILQTISLPLLRLSTDGHNEEIKIIASLKRAMGITGD